MSDPYRSHMPGLESPPSDLIAITPSDDAPLSTVVRGLNVAQSGAVRVETLGGTVGTVHVGAGVAFPLRVRRVFATGTSATGIVGLV